MSGVRKLEHATLRVTDLAEAIDFYTDVMGLVELDRTDDVVYLGCGLDGNYDLGLVEGKTGVEHFAVRVQDEDELDDYAERLEGVGVDTERTDGAEPGQALGLRFALPSGTEMELVTVENTDYLHPNYPVDERPMVAPRDLDHINLMTWNVDDDFDFLVDVLDFEVSDTILGETEFTVQAWTRKGDHHHDVALSTANDVVYSLHHLAFEMNNIEHIKALADRLATHGYDIELGPNRHNAGGNIFTYFWAPGGNRIELTAEIASVDAANETGVRHLSAESDTVSTWGGIPPVRRFLETGS